eukprot:jgi/Galph1/3949/GphlegSOOS_G2640.1
MNRSLLDFFLLCGQLKEEKRRGWVKRGVRGPESVSDHMYRMAMICLTVTDENLDRNKLVKLALVHDLGEALIGDITPQDGVSAEEKFRLEDEAFRKIRNDYLASLPIGHEIYMLWKEYETGCTEEAKFVKQVDKLEMLIQAYEYEKDQQLDLSEFFSSSSTLIQHHNLSNQLEELLSRRKR